MPTTTTDLQIISEDQSIWSTGDRAAITWSEYFPIIGGDRITFTLSNAEITQGLGRVVIDGEKLNWEPPASYESLANGVVETVQITFDMTDDNGDTTQRTIEITVTGTASGTAYRIPGVKDAIIGPFEFTHVSGSSEGGTEDKGLPYSAATTLPVSKMFVIDVITARDILQSAKQFDTMVPVDIDWDLMEGIHELAAAATSGLNAERDRALAEAEQARQAHETAVENLNLANAVIAADAQIAATQVARAGAYTAYQTARTLSDA